MSSSSWMCWSCVCTCVHTWESNAINGNIVDANSLSTVEVY